MLREAFGGGQEEGQAHHRQEQREHDWLPHLLLWLGKGLIACARQGWCDLRLLRQALKLLLLTCVVIVRVLPSMRWLLLG
jgi:hypothetical protein